MNEREEIQFRAIAMGELSESQEWQEVTAKAADYSAGMFALLKRYGIESTEGITFVCGTTGAPCLTITMESHLREHFNR
jgi:hypothetical protein